MNRVFIRIAEGGRAEIPREELHHLVSVLRTRPGEVFEGITGGEFRYRCRLAEEAGVHYGEVLEEIGHGAESPLQIELAAALIKREKFELIIQKATELGVSSIVPLLTTRTEIKLEPKRESAKMERWNRIIHESVKQCGRNRIPALEHSREFGEYLESSREANVLVLDEGSGEPLNSVIGAFKGLPAVTLIIGPEGGWSEEDRLLMKRCPNLRKAGLGPRVLRAETAAVAALALIQYELGDL